MQRLVSAWFVLAAACCSAVLPYEVRADGPSSEQSIAAAYDAAIQQGLQEYSLGHWTEAKVFFMQAHALQPNARTLRSLGLTCYESRSYVEAIAFFEQALASTVRPLTDQMRAETERFRRQASAFVSTARIDVQPPSAALTIDGKPVQLAPDRTIMLDPGGHTITATAAGYASATRPVIAEDGKALSVQLGLEAAPPSYQVAAHSVEVTASPRNLAASKDDDGTIAPWVVVGASAALAVAGGLFVAIALADKSKVEHAPEGGSWDAYRYDYRQGETFFAVGFTLLGVGVAGAAAGLTWKFWPQDSARDAAASLQVFPGGISLCGQM
jgi:hypothetical protein